MNHTLDLEALRTLLASFDIPYTYQEHPPLYTAEDRERLGLPVYGCVVKNLFLRNGCNKAFYLVVLPNHEQLDLRKLRDHIHSSRLSFATPEQLKKYLNVPQGSLGPLALLNDQQRQVQLLLSDSLAESDMLGIHPNRNDRSFWLTLRDILRLIRQHGSPYRFYAHLACGKSTP